MHSFFNKVIDFLLPPICLACEKLVTKNQALCVSCWNDINFISKPFCRQCGIPFGFEVESETLCGQCHSKKPNYNYARSVFVYNDASKSIILRLKHADQLQHVPALSNWMIRSGKEFWNEADLIIPVPLHRWRFLKRRYNQAALLAEFIGKETNINVVIDGLFRKKATKSQGHLSKKQRIENVAGSFSINPKLDVKGLNIVLIDDVITTGATVDECARLLVKKGASMVNVLTIARVVYD